MNRRDFLKNCMAMGLSFPALGYTPYANAKNSLNLELTDTILKGSTKVLIELQGGNDGLNTVVPFNDPLYKELRPTLALKSGEVITLNNELALHHSLEGLMPLWEKKQLQIVLGVGYEKPNLSHFRSIEIWDTASKSNQYLSDGWLAELLTKEDQPISGLVLGGGSGPLQGVENIISIKNINQFLKKQRRIDNHLAQHHAASQNHALNKIIETQKIIDQASERIKVKLKPLQAPQAFNKHPFARQVSLATQIIQSDLNIPVIKLSLGSFDTHINQKPKHARLLKMLAESLNTMHQALESTGHWNKTKIMTYSEFGRRAAENGSRGTDHGTAAPHFIIGGSVRGGIVGKQPSLANLNKNNLQYTTDFRQLYNLALKG